MGVLKWVDWTVSEPRYFQLQTDHTPVHLALLDEVTLTSMSNDYIWGPNIPIRYQLVTTQTIITKILIRHILRINLSLFLRSAHAIRSSILRCCSCSSNCLRQSTRSLMSWSRFVRDRSKAPPVLKFVAKFWLLFQMELKKTLLDRMVHLLSRGYVLPVVSYIRKCLEKLNTDISLIRYFVTEVKLRSFLNRMHIVCFIHVWAWFSKVFLSRFQFGQVLDVITPPYTSDFVQLFLPILENDSIAGTIRTEGEHDPVAEFIGELSTVLFKKQKYDSWDLNEPWMFFWGSTF